MVKEDRKIALFFVVGVAIAVYVFLFAGKSYSKEEHGARSSFHVCRPQNDYSGSCEKSKADLLAHFELERKNGPLRDEDELEYFLLRIECREPFALTRWGDGENFIITGEAVKSSRDSWEVKPGQDGGLAEDLRAALNLSSQSYFVGLPCKDREKTAPVLFQRTQSGHELTYATIWINFNYATFKKWSVETLVKQKNVFLMVSENSKQENLGWAAEVMLLPALGAGHWTEHRSNLIEKAEKLASSKCGWVFLISGGPMANVLVHRMWLRSKCNIYLDMGSSLDELVKGKVTTQYPADHACKNWGQMVQEQGSKRVSWIPFKKKLPERFDQLEPSRPPLTRKRELCAKSFVVESERTGSIVADNRYEGLPGVPVGKVAFPYGTTMNIALCPACKNEWWGGIKTWEPETFDVFHNFIDKNTIYLGFGSWIGPTLLFAMDRAKICVALEPDPAAYAILRDNVAANPIHRKNVAVYPFALLNTYGILKMRGNGGSDSRLAGDSSIRDPTNKGVGTTSVQEVPVLKVYDFMFSFGLLPLHKDEKLFLKIDTEGAESKIVPHLVDEIENFGSRKPRILLSNHGTIFRGSAATKEATLRLLKLYKYVVPIPVQHGGDVLPKPLDKTPTMNDLIDRGDFFLTDEWDFDIMKNTHKLRWK
jgi:FkbM family methyltransferase